MKPNYLIACLLTIGLPIGAAAGLRAQDTTNPAQAPTASQSTASQLSDVTDKPHAGTPLQQDSTVSQADQQATPGTPGWYKDSPQNYDHGTAKPRHLRAPKGKLQVYDDGNPPTRQTAQQDAPQQDDGQVEQGQPDDQPLPQRHIQAVPQYYAQPRQQSPQPQGQQQYAQDQARQYGQQGYAQQQYPQQQYPQQQQYSQQENGRQNDNQPNYAEQGQPQDGPDDYPPDDNGAAPVQPTQAPLSAQQLEQLVAPIALYPDQLVAQIMTAATYPAQITAADQMVRQMNGASADQIAQAANGQTSWDPSVKALTAFPQVLQMLDSNLQWTSALGNAYYNQPQDVMQTVQALRDRAQQAGNLQSTPQEQVEQQPNQIQIEPTNPDYVYVPSYNPWYAYGAPIDPYPSFEFGNWGLYGGGGIDWGLRFAVAPWGRFGFGWGGWGVDWLGSAILFNHGNYWTHSREMRDWGFRHGGPRWAGGGRGWYGRGNGGRDYARFGNYHNQPIRAYPGGSEHSPLGRGYGVPHQSTPQTMRGFGRVEGGGPVRPEAPRQQAFGRMPDAYGRPQQFRGAQPGGGQSFGNRPQPFGGQGFPGRPQGFNGAPYRTPMQAPQGPRAGQGFGGGYPRPGQGFAGRPEPPQNFRSPQAGGPRGFGGGYPGGGYQGGGRSFAQPQPRSGGGFHGFGGGGHSQPSFGGGGHSFGGGGHAFSGGGGHSFGGGGGHSFGGGGGHSGGHHR